MGNIHAQVFFITMRIIKPSVMIIPQGEGLEGMYKQIEIAGRTCYKSDSNIKEGSARKFTDRMISSGHLAVLEHGTVYLKYPGIRYLDIPYCCCRML